MGEILISIVFLAISILAVIGIQTYATQSQLKAGAHFRASQKAEAVMADIEEALRGDLDRDVSVARVALPPEYNPEGTPDFDYEVISNFLGAPSDRLKAATVNVYWSGRQGEQSFTCESRFTE